MTRSSAAYIHDMEKIARDHGPAHLVLIVAEIVTEWAGETKSILDKRKLNGATYDLLKLHRSMKGRGL